MSTRHVMSLAMVVVAPSVWAINLLDNGKDKDYLDYANQPQFASVGRLDVTLSGGGTSTGTASFIGFGKGRGWILTARHVIVDYVTAESFFRVGDRSWKFSSSYKYLGDLAVISLVDIKQGDLTPLPFLNYVLPIPADKSKRSVASVIGFGDSGTGSAPGTKSDGRKRGMLNSVDGFDVKTFNKDGSEMQTYEGYMTDFDNGKVEGNSLDVTDNKNRKLAAGQTSNRLPQTLEGGLGSGDSGGPLMVQVDKTWVIAGVSESTYFGEGYGSWSAYMPTNAENARWISKNTGIGSVPEPSTLWVVSLGAAFLKGRKSRRRRC